MKSKLMAMLLAVSAFLGGSAYAADRDVSYQDYGYSQVQFDSPEVWDDEPRMQSGNKIPKIDWGDVWEWIKKKYDSWGTAIIIFGEKIIEMGSDAIAWIKDRFSDDEIKKICDCLRDIDSEYEGMNIGYRPMDSWYEDEDEDPFTDEEWDIIWEICDDYAP